MEFTKRDIKKPEPPAVIEEENKTSKEKPCPTCGDNNTETNEDSNTNPETIKKRFIVISVPSEMFEYSDIKRFSLSLPYEVSDSNYDQIGRQSLFSYDSNLVDGKNLISNWTEELKSMNKRPSFSMRTMNVPIPKEEIEK